MKYEIRCSACNEASANLLVFKCPSCGEPLDVLLDFDFEPEEVRRNDCSVWRYLRFFPYVQENRIITLGEGWTPFVRLSGNIYVKLESQNPTGSFKDRGSTVLVSALHRLIEEAGGYISEDSSGNAGASMAAYAARAGLKTRIYVPETVVGPKFSQIQFHGAQVTKVSGSRSNVAEEAQRAEKGKFYVGHILHPLFRDGIRSLAYEIFEQFGLKVPEHVYLPVSAGTLLLGVMSGFKHLQNSGMIEKAPRIVACQTRQVSPLYHKLKRSKYDPPETATSIADALLSVDPPMLDVMAKNLEAMKGDALIVEEDEIRVAYLELARKGFFVEPSSAVAYAGYRKQLKNNEVSTGSSTVIVLTGHGLKTTLKQSIC
jgi:threonine synthase